MPFFVFVSLFNILISRLHIRFSPLVNSSSSLFFLLFFLQVTPSSNNRSISLGKLGCNLMPRGIQAWRVFICSYFGILLTSWNRTPRRHMPRGDTDADEAAGVLLSLLLLLLLLLFPSHVDSVSTLSSVYRILQRCSPCREKQKIRFLLNSIFAPIWFCWGSRPL